MNPKLRYIPALLLFFASCSADVADFDRQYLNLKVVIEQTELDYNKKKPIFQKEVSINGQTEKIVSKEIDWSKELEVFLTLDLNKRDYLNKYAIDSTEKLIKYTLLATEEAPVREVKVRFDDAGISDVDAILKTENFLYSSERILALRFATRELVRYEVSGWQQLFIGGKKYYHVNAQKKGYEALF